jgi:hypothetical protein
LRRCMASVSSSGGGRHRHAAFGLGAVCLRANGCNDTTLGSDDLDLFHAAVKEPIITSFGSIAHPLALFPS